MKRPAPPSPKFCRDIVVRDALSRCAAEPVDAIMLAHRELLAAFRAEIRWRHGVLTEFIRRENVLNDGSARSYERLCKAFDRRVEYEIAWGFALDLTDPASRPLEPLDADRWGA